MIDGPKAANKTERRIVGRWTGGYSWISNASSRLTVVKVEGPLRPISSSAFAFVLEIDRNINPFAASRG